MLPGFLPFERLPKELIVYALQFCCFTDILRFSATCRKYFYLVHNTTSLQLQIELEANRLQTASNHTPVGQQQLLEALKGYRDNWLDLSLVQGQIIVRAPNGELFTLWELRGGILANGYSTLEFRDLQANALQLVSLDDPLSRWNLTFQEYFDELTMDPSQDLLVLTTVDQTNSNMLSVRFCSLRTGLAHPLAMRPVVLLQLEFSVTPYPTYSTICLYIVDELLLLNLVCNEFVEPSNGVFCEVLVLNWRTGELLNRMGKCEGFCSAICLDRDRLAVFFVQTISSAMPPSSMSLLLYDDIRTPRAACLPQSEAVCCISAYTPLRSVLSLGFPEFNPGAVIVLPDFLVRSEPLPSDLKHSGPRFIPDPLYRTLCLTMRLADEVDHANVVVFIDVQRLLHYLSQRSTRSLLWHEWGEEATRWTELLDPPSHWISCMRGSRFVMSKHIQDQPSQLMVADFNTTLVRRFKTRESDRYKVVQAAQQSEDIADGIWPYITQEATTQERSECEMVVSITEEDAPTVIRDLSATPIISKLPYRLSTVAGPLVTYNDWMIDGNRLIGIKTNPEGISELLVTHYINE